ncbi:DUF6520 family protein [Flavobacterium galactosidilyticum]|uniref:DUF6520 family protein n=1 Tax=Flavobacterium galactosidilyticum TaxID=2893886 RepID=UPI001E54243F|nr:DUF6520 family protein [Flavobacterium sp. F-340]UFH45357.1 DUF6520 family protein [Flavobacterium sp. F-340]
MKKLIVPMLVIVAAATSAFSTDASAKRSSGLVPGFIPHNAQGTDCEQKNDCSNVNNGIVCRVGQVSTGAQLKIMDGNDECVLTGYKP